MHGPVQESCWKPPWKRLLAGLSAVVEPTWKVFPATVLVTLMLIVKLRFTKSAVRLAALSRPAVPSSWWPTGVKVSVPSEAGAVAVASPVIHVCRWLLVEV